MRYIFGFFGLILLMVACEEKQQTRAEYIQEKLETRLEKRRMLRQKKCFEELNTKAHFIADSILYAEALRQDSLTKGHPNLPPKPAFIEPKADDQAGDVKPFLDTLQ